MKYRVIGSLIVLAVIVVLCLLFSQSSQDDGNPGTDTPPAAAQ
jgi:hypothetical protein